LRRGLLSRIEHRRGYIRFAVYPLTACILRGRGRYLVVFQHEKYLDNQHLDKRVSRTYKKDN
jgi:hypothetical protein